MKQFLTEIIGRTVLNFDAVDSTNAFLKDRIETTSFEEGTVVRSNFQSAGRGQRSTLWESEAFQNLLMSIFLVPDFLPADQQWRLNEAVTIGLYRALANFTDGQQLQIKWPNDLLLDGHKVAGILIESAFKGQQIEHSIVGIGVNINQTDFDETETATSFKKAGMADQDVDEIFRMVIAELDRSYVQLQHGLHHHDEYLGHLYGYGKEFTFIEKGKEKKGSIVDIDSFGRLIVETNGGQKRYDTKEIVFKL